MFFEIEKLIKQIEWLKLLRYGNRVSLPPFKCTMDESKEEKYPYVFESDELVQKGSVITDRDSYYWLQSNVEIPDIKGKKFLFLFDLRKYVDGNTSGFEALLFINGELYQAVDGNHKEVFIDEKYSDQTIEVSLKLWTGLEGGGPHKEITHHIQYMDMAYLDETLDYLYYLSNTIIKTVQILDENDSTRVFLLKQLNQAFNQIDWNAVKYYQNFESAYNALNLLENAVSQMPKDTEVKVTAIGHTHIDVAWLWRLKHTREKAARSFTTVLRLMEQYPEYVFLQTQPQVYEYIKEDYPELYEKIKEKIDSGKWEIDGAMWLESDANLPSGESLVRQILQGKKFMKEEFNKVPEYLWLPDVFGYSWAIPQILKKSGIDMFMTTKISWNQFNRMPHDTFVWKGIDGSEVLTHFITTPDPKNEQGPFFYTYNGVIEPYTVKGIYDGYRDKNINSNLLLAYGYGDGGGGVTRDMLESIRTIDKMPGLPSIKTGRADEYFNELKETFKNTKEYVHKWDGELYLEYHRGTYTSQARNKKWNRKLELKLKLAELKATFDKLNNNREYPYNEFTQSWKSLLRNQFHDIIPGSSITEVYEDSEIEYSEINNQLDLILNDSEEGQFVVINDANWNRTNVIVDLSEIDKNVSAIVVDGEQIPTYSEEDRIFAVIPSIKALSVNKVELNDGDLETAVSNENEITFENSRLETPFYTIRISEEGWISSIYDKESDREVISDNKYGNQLVLYEDMPLNWDAWDIDIFHKDKFKVLEAKDVSLSSMTPNLSKLKFEYEFGNSKLTQYMIVYNNNRRIDFETVVDWHEKQTLLRTKFELDIRTTFAKYDIQYGHVMRPNHWNTSWDWARFESVGHQWADLSQQDYGVALLNDSKYGYSIKENVMQLSLLKGAIYPDPFADEGVHEFTYSLLPHKNSLVESDTIEQAYDLNAPLKVVKMDLKENITQLFEVESSGRVVVDAIKLSEEKDGIILRFHEANGANQTVDIKPLFDYVNCIETNLVEEEIGEMDTSVKLTPFEVKTMKFVI